MQIATWNVNSLSVRLEQVLAWLQTSPVDLLALQETKTTDDKFPQAQIEAAGYQVAFFGQKSYNGVALLMRQPAVEIQKNLPDFEDESARVISATLAGVRVVGVYVPNGQAPGSDKFAYKMRWLTHLRGWLAEQLQRYPKLVLLGDFNITFDDRDVWDPVGMKEQIHCTSDERGQLQALLGLGLNDAFRCFEQPDKSYSWWDYRAGALRANHGLRIDHILVSAALRPLLQSCTIDKAPRKNQRPSDHAPVLLTLKDDHSGV